jgi:hypothetical protein
MRIKRIVRSRPEYVALWKGINTMMRALIHKYCRYLLSWPRGFADDRRGVVVVFVALAMRPRLLIGMRTSATCRTRPMPPPLRRQPEPMRARPMRRRPRRSPPSWDLPMVPATSRSRRALLPPSFAPRSTRTPFPGTPIRSRFQTTSRCSYRGWSATPETRPSIKKGMTAMTATASAASCAAYPYCILALGNVTNDIDTNGSPNADLEGCNVMSDTGANCSGHDLNAAVGDAYGTNDGCGKIQNSNVPKVSDPYSGSAPTFPRTLAPPIQRKREKIIPSRHQTSGAAATPSAATRLFAATRN